MTPRVALPVMAALLAGACGGSKQVVATAAPSAVGTEVSRDALVYAAVVRQLVTRYHGFGGAASPYRHVYVLDGVVPDASDPMHVVDRPSAPFEAALARQIAAELRALPPVSFVHSRGHIVSGRGPGHVVGRGVLITLGRIEWLNPRTARVGNSRWASGLNGQWLTYIVKYQRSGWRVVGVAGRTAAIS